MYEEPEVTALAADLEKIDQGLEDGTMSDQDAIAALLSAFDAAL